MSKAKPIKVSLASHFKFLLAQSPVDDKEKNEMSLVSYANAIGSLMYSIAAQA